MKAYFGALVLVAGVLLGGSAFLNANAQTGMEVNVTTTDGNDLTISGTTSKSDNISAKVENSTTDALIFVGQMEPASDGSFSFHTSTEAGWAEDGIYHITVKQDDTTSFDLKLNVRVQDGKIIDNVMKSSVIDNEAEIVTTPRIIPKLEIDVLAEVGTQIIEINGTTTSQTNQPILVVRSPIGNIIHTDQLQQNASGAFSTEIVIGCQQWSEDGMYHITVSQGGNSSLSSSAQVDIGDCHVIPEFGPIAMLVLVVSIVAIVIMGARTKTSIMPRF